MCDESALLTRVRESFEPKCEKWYRERKPWPASEARTETFAELCQVFDSELLRECVSEIVRAMDEIEDEVRSRVLYEILQGAARRERPENSRQGLEERDDSSGEAGEQRDRNA